MRRTMSVYLVHRRCERVSFGSIASKQWRAHSDMSAALPSTVTMATMKTVVPLSPLRFGYRSERAGQGSPHPLTGNCAVG